MTKFKTYALTMITIFAFILTGCSTITLAEKGAWSPGKEYSLTLGRDWTEISEKTDKGSAMKLLTIDGPDLNLLIAVDGMKYGDSIIDQVRKDNPVPRFTENMTDSELVALVEDSVARLGFKQVHAKDIRPVPFGAYDGVRLGLTAVTKDGLNITGDSVFSVYNDKLHMLTFLAPNEHYFDALSGEVSGIFQSIRQAKAGENS